MAEPDRSQPGSPDQASRLRLVAAQPGADWSRLADAANEREYCSTWLNLQCSRIPNVVAGLLGTWDPTATSSTILAVWPESGFAFDELTKLAERAHLERRPVISPGRIGREVPLSRSVSLLQLLPEPVLDSTVLWPLP